MANSSSARADGHALGGGFVLTLCRDYRLAVDDGTICLIDVDEWPNDEKEPTKYWLTMPRGVN